MSQENIEVVRRLYTMLTRGDDRLLDLLAAFFNEARETWGELPAWEPEELIDAGDKVFAFIRTSAQGKASGAEVEARVANVWTFRDGKPVELKYFGEDRAAALEAARLGE